MPVLAEPAAGRNPGANQSAPHEAIHLSVVATSRNDDHGGCLTRRTQLFVDGLIAQCKRHGLRAELILVEWNPPPDKTPLSRELQWPADTGPCDVRVLTVPPEVHQTFKHADSIRLFQMLAKNAGIRRARGKFILATNIDILFSDDAMRFLRDRLQPGQLYLADRVDVPSEVPSAGDFQAVLRFCEERALRVNAGGLTVERSAGRWRYRDKLKATIDPRAAYLLHMVEEFFRLALNTFANPRWAYRRLLGHGLARSGPQPRGPGNAATGVSHARLTMLLARGAWEIAYSIASGIWNSLRRVREPFTNACGDFTAMSREDWLRVRGYAEWNIFSWHLDTLLVYQALGCGVRVQRLAPKARVYHIDHAGGYTPQQAAELFARLKARAIPFITDEELRRLYADIIQKRRSGQDTQLNEAGWGLAALPLAEARPGTT